VETEICFINERIHAQDDEIKYLNNHLNEHKRDMDHLEKNAMRESITNTAAIGDHSVEKKKRLARFKHMPYFGRIDFRENGNGKPKPVYVGVHNFFDEDTNTNLVYDWQAPTSSMFYDFELGDAFYEMIDAKISGSIDLKRQFHIREGEMEYMLGSEITIQDDALRKELNQALPAKRKKIRQNIAVEAIERHGEKPEVYSLKNEPDEINHIQPLIDRFLSSNYNFLNIICKKQPQADELYDALKDKYQVELMNALSVAFGSGIVIISAHLAKGLEFDNVIVSHASWENYNSEPDRQMLYVACTRAIHGLYLTYSGDMSPFLN